MWSDSTVYGFNIKDTNIRDKRKALRNMVDPKIGKHIFNQMKENGHKNKIETKKLF